jgi:hypothetical protein
MSRYFWPATWFWCFFIFVAWLVAAEGWVRWLAPLWLAYPAYNVRGMWRARRKR